ncbi:hypothetical protein [Hyphobacterium sp.]|uniref:hypothetical protein n=1 Tax=Hyphobacterium sp. TaxID=2004662 RepID=UPI003B5202CB
MTQPDPKPKGHSMSAAEREALAPSYLHGEGRGKLSSSPAMRSAWEARSEPIESVDPATQESWTGHGRPRGVARKAPDGKGGTVLTDVQREERDRARERLAALRVIADDFAKASGVERVQAFTVYARGEIRRGHFLRALAPTRQIAEWAQGRGRNRAWLTIDQLVALSLYRGLHDARIVGRAVSDMEAPRVDGGGAGDTLLAIIRASDAGRRFERARRSIVSPFSRRVVDAVVISDLQLDAVSLGAEFPFQKQGYIEGARRLAVLQGANDLARHFGN